MLDRLLFGPTAGAPPRTQLFPNFHLTLHICCQKPYRAIIFFSLQIGSSTTACSKSFFSFTVNFHLLNVALSFLLFLCFWTLTVTFVVFQSQSQSHTQTHYKMRGGTWPRFLPKILLDAQGFLDTNNCSHAFYSLSIDISMLCFWVSMLFFALLATFLGSLGTGGACSLRRLRWVGGWSGFWNSTAEEPTFEPEECGSGGEHGRGTWFSSRILFSKKIQDRGTEESRQAHSSGHDLDALSLSQDPPHLDPHQTTKNNTSIGDTSDFQRPQLLCTRSEPRPWSSVGGMWVGRGTWSRNMVQQPDTFFEIFRAEEQWDSSRYIPLLNMWPECDARCLQNKRGRQPCDILDQHQPWLSNNRNQQKQKLRLLATQRRKKNPLIPLAPKSSSFLFLSF